MKKTIAWILFVIWILSIIGCFYFYDRCRDSELTATLAVSQSKLNLANSEAEKERIQAHSDSTIKAEREIRAKHDKEDSLREVSYKREKMASTTKITELQKEREKAGIKPDTSTLKIEAEFTAQQARDSIEIAKLKASATLAEESFQSEIKAIETKLVAEINTSGLKDVVITNLEIQVSQERKKVKAWKIVTGIIAIAFVVDEFRE